MNERAVGWGVERQVDVSRMLCRTAHYEATRRVSVVIVKSTYDLIPCAPQWPRAIELDEEDFSEVSAFAL